MQTPPAPRPEPPSAQDFFKHFEECFDRFCTLHSWYKYGGTPTRIRVVPVLGAPQEAKKSNPNFANPLAEDEIYWHFYVNHFTPEYEGASAEFQYLVEQCSIMLSNFYQSSSVWIPTHNQDKKRLLMDLMQQRNRDETLALARKAAYDLIYIMYERDEPLNLPRFRNAYPMYDTKPDSNV